MDLKIKTGSSVKSDVLKVGSEVLACIRSENVMVLREGYYRDKQDNLLKGRVIHIFEKGKSHTLIFRPTWSEHVIEVEIPDFAIKKMGLHEGMEISVSLKSESLFLLNR